VTFRQHVPEKHVSWDTVIEEVLCSGWIDSLPREPGAGRTMVLLTPRRPGSPWSRLNKQCIQKLLAASRIMPPGLAAIEMAQQDGSRALYDEIEDLVVPEDLAAALKNDEKAALFFDAFRDSSKKRNLSWPKSAKKLATRTRCIAESVSLVWHNVKANSSEARAFKGQQFKM